jgi:hypothetical protein
MIVRLILGGAAAAAAPETSTWALMLAGLAGLGLTGYRKAGRTVRRDPVEACGSRAHGRAHDDFERGVRT